MIITTHRNGMWGVIVWSGDVDGHAALITSSRLATRLWVFKYIKGGWFKSDTSYWDNVKSFKSKKEAFDALGVIIGKN